MASVVKRKNRFKEMTREEVLAKRERHALRYHKLSNEERRTPNRALIGWVEIGDFLGLSPHTVKNRKMKWMKAGILFYIKVGKPPQRKVAVFPNILQAHIMREGKV